MIQKTLEEEQWKKNQSHLFEVHKSMWMFHRGQIKPELFRGNKKDFKIKVWWAIMVFRCLKSWTTCYHRRKNESRKCVFWSDLQKDWNDLAWPHRRVIHAVDIRTSFVKKNGANSSWLLFRSDLQLQKPFGWGCRCQKRVTWLLNPNFFHLVLFTICVQ